MRGSLGAGGGVPTRAKCQQAKTQLVQQPRKTNPRPKPRMPLRVSRAQARRASARESPASGHKNFASSHLSSERVDASKPVRLDAGDRPISPIAWASQCVVRGTVFVVRRERASGLPARGPTAMMPPCPAKRHLRAQEVHFYWRLGLRTRKPGPKRSKIADE